ncbi:acyltransferase [Rathayibacter sp. SD072]|uniref:acyltransferase family protein n=1 Tax=Rathayibacter sp. SD072 TaxID=2781731 RepID=UPI001A97A68E|nr:acyltransferase [Rathayibacter sp. SD072]MBO0982901.1 acyltransferase [Rathayibacter sp. SD072]
MQNPVGLLPGRIPSLNGLRAVAIVLVVWGHSGLPIPVKGSIGVTLFFFLSGYLITHLMRVESERTGRIALKDFYLRRVYRIFPPLYIVLAVVLLLVAAGALVDTITGAGLASASTFWANYYIVFQGREGLPPAMNALWSLAVEEHFYLLFPLVYVVLRSVMPKARHQAALLAAVCLVIAAWRVYLSSSGVSWDRLYLSTDTRADAILWGSVMAIAANPMYGETRIVTRRPWVALPLLLISVAIFIGVSRTPDWFGMTLGYTVQSLSLFGVFVAVITAPDGWVGRMLNARPVAYIGVLSYTLYLIHRPLLEVVHPFVPGGAGVVLAVLASLVFAHCLHLVVEKPLERVRRRISHTSIADPAPGPA